MTKIKRIFIDASGWIEFLLKGEIYHKKVNDYFFDELKKGSRFFTSDYVLDEAFTRLLTCQSFRSAKALRTKTKQAEKQKELLIFFTDETIFNNAWKIFTKFSEHKFSFTDAAIMSFVEKFKIDEILTLDQGFKRVGLTIRPLID